MPKIAFIGAGSFQFTRSLVRDLLTFPAFTESTLALMDVSEERLDFAKAAVGKIIEAGKYPAKVIATTDRAEALDGADGVVCTIQVGCEKTYRADIEIPKKYGVDINVGDTRGPAGVFRALRTMPVMLDIAHDIERLCPDATFLNYTNPMAMLCRALQTETKTKTSGLCHSVQGTARMLARWIGAPDDEITYLCAGLNHQAWYLDFKWNGKDAYPLIHQAVTTRPEILNEEQVRNEMFLQLGYYITESSGHNSEYVAWFRKRPDLIEQYCTHSTGWNPGHWGMILWGYNSPNRKTFKEYAEEELAEPVDLNRGREYAASIFNAIFGDGTRFEFNGNVLNHGLIDNVMPGCCVEVPVVASRRGLDALHVGPMPPQLAILNNLTAACEEMAVQGCLEGNREMIFHSIAYDPLTSAVCSLAEIRSMVNEMFEANAGWIPTFER